MIHKEKCRYCYNDSTKTNSNDMKTNPDISVGTLQMRCVKVGCGSYLTKIWKFFFLCITMI